MQFMFAKMPNRKNSNRLPGVFITGETITSMNNSTNMEMDLDIYMNMDIIRFNIFIVFYNVYNT